LINLELSILDKKVVKKSKRIRLRTFPITPRTATVTAATSIVGVAGERQEQDRGGDVEDGVEEED
jgi:hypothetical protein